MEVTRAMVKLVIVMVMLVMVVIAVVVVVMIEVLVSVKKNTTICLFKMLFLGVRSLAELFMHCSLGKNGHSLTFVLGPFSHKRYYPKLPFSHKKKLAKRYFLN